MRDKFRVGADARLISSGRCTLLGVEKNLGFGCWERIERRWILLEVEVDRSWQTVGVTYSWSVCVQVGEGLLKDGSVYGHPVW